MSYPINQYTPDQLILVWVFLVITLTCIYVSYFTKTQKMKKSKLEMANMQQIIDRYKGCTPKHQSSVTGFLALGGHSYYKKGSDEPININSTFGVEFITNEKGKVETYKINDKGTLSRWGQAIDKYYMWAWLPKKEIKTFEVVRIMPHLKLGDIIKVPNDHTTIRFILQYPEFYKPIYK